MSLLELKQTMADLTEAHHQLLNLAEQKQIILVEGKISELQNIIIKESKNIDRILKLEEKREQGMKEFLKESDFDQDSPIMDQFIKKIVEPEEKQWFTNIIRQLRDIVQKLSQLNKNNQELIQMNLSYLQYSINILIPKDLTIGYGKESTVRSAKLLDAKI